MDFEKIFKKVLNENTLNKFSNIIREYNKMNYDNNEQYNNNDSEFHNIFVKLDTLDTKDNKNNKLKESVRNIKKELPQLLDEETTDEENLNYLIKEVFREDWQNIFYFTNASYIDEKKNNKEIRRLYLRPQKGQFLQERMPDNLTLSFRGFISIGFFVINEISIIGEHDGKKDNELEIKVIPYHTNIPRGHRGEYLNELINNTESIREHLNKNLENWREYLSWKQELVKIRLAGIKYFNCYYYYDDRRDLPNIVFQLVSPSKKDFEKIRKYLRRENIKVFDNNYSINEWKFNFDERNRSLRRAIDLGKFSDIIKERHYNPTPEEIQKINNSDKLYKGRDFNINGEYKNNIEKISENPYLIEMAFEIGEDYYDEIRDKELNKTEMEEFINNEIIRKINRDKGGFLALSAVGEFALNRRLREAISKLGRDEGYAPNLASWLFDIKKAEVPSIENVNIEKWLNKGIENNEHQKLAVRKMIATKDVCLIQGPPGTGKTTVIAEAIYQFALRGERVLIASQTNLAVDNALERLAKEPVIRAIRLNASKTTEDIAHMTEDKVLKYFFSNISNKLKENYLNNWENNEKILNNIEIHLRDIGQYLEQKNHYNNQLNKLVEERNNLNRNIENLNNNINEIKNKNSEINGIKNQMNLFNNFINGLINNKDSESDFVLPKDFTSKILDDIRLPLNLLNEINLDRLNIRNINDIGNDILTNGLKEIFKNVYRFYDLTSLVSKSDNKSNPELESLKSKRDEIKDKMGASDISDEEYDKLSDEFRKLNKEISNFKMDTFELKETHKALLSDNIKNEFMASKDTNIIKEVINKNIAEVDNINKVLHNMKSYLDDYELSLKEEDYKQKENELKTSEGRLSVILEDENKMREYLKDIDNKINKLKRENNIENDINDNDIYSRLENRRQELSNIIKDGEALKNKFGDFIKEFNNKLENIDIKYENEYYKETYINSCNVVGISCTENPKILEEKEFKHFDVAIIDEVSKATPPELLIPMLKAKKVILVGDHRQLPPLFGEYERSYKEIVDNIEDTDENKEVKEILTEENFKKFENMVTSSIFKEYFEEANENIKHSLLSQFRMHSDIMEVINRFYENRLKSGLLESGMTKEKENEAKAHLLEIKRINNLPFITKDRHAYWIDSSVIKTRQSKEEKIYESMTSTSTSIYNVLEAHIAVELIKKIATEYKKLNLGRQVSVGIISLYQLQVNRIRDMIKKERRKKFDFSAVNIDVNTVDRFQGKEKEIIIVSLVRNPESGKSHSKHITAFERVNVAFSRAQNALFIIGAETLYKDLDVEMPYMDRKGSFKRKVYKDIIEYLYRNACFFQSDCVIDYNKADIILNEYDKNHKNNRNSNNDNKNNHNNANKNKQNNNINNRNNKGDKK